MGKGKNVGYSFNLYRCHCPRVANAQMLTTLYVCGPHSSGLFRRSANHAKVQAAKVTLDAGGQFNFDEAPLPITAALLKVRDAK